MNIREKNSQINKVSNSRVSKEKSQSKTFLKKKFLLVLKTRIKIKLKIGKQKESKNENSCC